MKTLIISALGAAFVAASFLAGATWAASSEAPPPDAERQITVYSGSTAITLPAAVLARMPSAQMALAQAPTLATARPAPRAGEAVPERHVHLVLRSSDASR